jgi:hypothetical protein
MKTEFRSDIDRNLLNSCKLIHFLQKFVINAG